MEAIKMEGIITFEVLANYVPKRAPKETRIKHYTEMAAKYDSGLANAISDFKQEIFKYFAFYLKNLMLGLGAEHLSEISLANLKCAKAVIDKLPPDSYLSRLIEMFEANTQRLVDVHKKTGLAVGGSAPQNIAQLCIEYETIYEEFFSLLSQYRSNSANLHSYDLDCLTNQLQYGGFCGTINGGNFANVSQFIGFFDASRINELDKIRIHFDFLDPRREQHSSNGLLQTLKKNSRLEYKDFPNPDPQNWVLYSQIVSPVQLIINCPVKYAVQVEQAVEKIRRQLSKIFDSDDVLMPASELQEMRS